MFTSIYQRCDWGKVEFSKNICSNKVKSRIGHSINCHKYKQYNLKRLLPYHFFLKLYLDISNATIPVFGSNGRKRPRQAVYADPAHLPVRESQSSQRQYGNTRVTQNNVYSNQCDNSLNINQYDACNPNKKNNYVNSSSSYTSW